MNAARVVLHRQGEVEGRNRVGFGFGQMRRRGVTMLWAMKRPRPVPRRPTSVL